MVPEANDELEYPFMHSPLLYAIAAEAPSIYLVQVHDGSDESSASGSGVVA